MEENKSFVQESDKIDLINDSQVNNLMLLYQVHPKVSYTVIPKNGSHQSPQFIAECKIDDTNTFYGEGPSKQKAKLDAATAALKYLNQTNQMSIPQKKKRSSSREGADKTQRKIKKQETPADLKHVSVVINLLFPKLQYVFSKDETPSNVCQVEVNGRLFAKDGSSKKNARMNVCVDIIQTLYGPEHLETVGDMVYVKKSFWEGVQSGRESDVLEVPRICKNLHPTLFLNNIFQALEYKDATEKQGVVVYKHVYTLQVEGRVYSGVARSKKTAKMNCAINAINGLQGEGAMLEQRLEMAKLARLSTRKAKFDMYNKNKSLSSDPRIRTMIGARNFKFTNFKKSATPLDPNQGVMYASNFEENSENNYHTRGDNKFHQGYLSPPSQIQPVFQSNIYQQQQQQSFQQQQQQPQQPPHEAYYNQSSNNNRYLSNSTNNNNFFPYTTYNQLKPGW